MYNCTKLGLATNMLNVRNNSEETISPKVCSGIQAVLPSLNLPYYYCNLIPTQLVYLHFALISLSMIDATFYASVKQEWILISNESHAQLSH